MYANIALKNFLRENKKEIIGVIFPDFIIPKKSFFGSVRFLLKKSFFQFCLYKWFEEKIYRIKTSLNIGQLKPFIKYSKEYKFPIFKTADINSEETINLMKKLRPDIIYSVSYPQKIKEEVLKIPKNGCINFHDSLLPKYRGLCAYFWVTANNEKKGGVTAHYINTMLDTGEIILQKKYTIDTNDTMQRVYYKSSKLIEKMISEINNKLKKGKIKSIKQKEGGHSYFSWPNREGYALFRKNKKRFFRFEELWNSM